MNKYITLFFIVLLVQINSFSQDNLIVNGDFESYFSDKKNDTSKNKSPYPNRRTEWYACPVIKSKHWNTLDPQKSIRYCKNKTIARSGNICSQIKVYDNINIEHNLFSYNNLIGNFASPLVKGNRYKITFYLKPFIGDFLSDKFEVFISDSLHQDLAYKEFTVLEKKNKYYVKNKNEYIPTFSIDEILKDTLNYTKFEFIYTSKGNEMYIYFGNITGDIPSKMIKQKFGYNPNEFRNPIRILLIDDISVVPLGLDAFDCKNNENEAELSYLELRHKEEISLLFQSNSFVLDSSQKRILHSFFKEIHQQQFQIYSVLIKSFANDIGKKNDNFKLSENRANFVLNYLTNNFNLDTNNIHYYSVGEIKTNLFSDIQEQQINNRKVILEISYSEKITSHTLFETIVFEASSTKLLHDYTIVLEKLSSFLQKNKKIEIEIQGHICCLEFEGSNRNNQFLSKQRAKLIYEYLLKKRIDKERMSYFGVEADFPKYGKKEPKHYLNRRVKILFKVKN